MPNINIKCQDCGETFFFTEKDQKFYQEKGVPLPKRCYSCRQAKKNKYLNNKKEEK